MVKALVRVLQWKWAVPPWELDRESECRFGWVMVKAPARVLQWKLGVPPWGLDRESECESR